MIAQLLYILVFALLSAGLWLVARRRPGRIGILLGLMLLLAIAALQATIALGMLPASLADAPPFQSLAAAYQEVVRLVTELMAGITAKRILQLLILGAYLGLGLFVDVLWVALRAIRWLWRLLRRRIALPTGPGATVSNGRRPLVQAAGTALLLYGSVLALLPFAADRSPALDRHLGDLIWIGAWILLIELAASIDTSRGRSGRPRIAGIDAGATRVDLLERLYGAYIGRHRKALYLCRIQPPSGEGVAQTEPPPDGSIAGLLNARLRGLLAPALLQRLLEPATHVDQGGDLLLGESLCAHHFLLLSELIQATVNSGRSVLIVCPRSGIAEIRDSLEMHADSNLRRLLQHWAQIGSDDLLPDTTEDLLLCPDDALEQLLLGRLDLLQNRLQRLGLVVLLDIQALSPPSVVRLALARLRALAGGGQEPVRLVMQGAAYAQIEPLARSLFASDRIREFRVQAHLQGHRYVLVWDRGAPMQDHRERYFPGLQERVGPDALLLMPAWELGVPVARLDPGNRHDEDSLERLKFHLPAYDHPPDVVGLAREHVPVGHGYVSGGAAVSLLDDPGNLLIALDHDGGSSGRTASLINVLCGNYLMRDYLRAVIAAAEDPKHLPTELRPLAPRPRGNPYTLAHALSLGLSHDDGLTVAEIEDQFLAPMDSRLLLEHLDIRPTRASLQRFLRGTLGLPTLEVLVDWPAGHERRYRMSPLQRPELAEYAEVLNEQGDSLGRMLRWNHGLTYAKGQTLLLDHKYHLVTHVGPAQIRVQHAEAVAQRAPRHFTFHRRYRLSRPHTAVLEQDPIVRERAGGLVLSLSFQYLEMERETLGYLSLDERLRPFASDPPALEYTRCAKPIAWRFPLQGVTRVSISGIAKDAPVVDSSGNNDNDPARIALTLCLVVQDAMQTLFPEHHRQIAVVSPQAPSPPVLGEGDERLGWLYERLYPTLVPNDDQDASSRGAPAGDTVELYIIEDSRFDLGVARALGDWPGLQHLLTNVRNYLRWAVDQPPEQLYQAFGASAPHPSLDYSAALALLERLTDADPPPPTADLGESCHYQPDADSDRTLRCDFCAGRLGGAYDRLQDGRTRCERCGGDPVDTPEVFLSVYREVREGMQGHYHLDLPRDIGILFVDAARLAAAVGETFVPTADLDPRAVGVAIRNRDGSRLMLLENGAPRVSTVATLAHELTHLWQYGLGIDFSKQDIELLEGQARLVEIDFLRRVATRIPGAGTLATGLEQDAMRGEDIYARGYQRVIAACRSGDDGLFQCLKRQLHEARDQAAS